MSCWPLTTTITTTMAAASMFAKLSDRLANFVCGISPTATTVNDDGYSILSPSSPAEMLYRPRSRSRSWSSSSRVSAPDDAADADDEEEGEEDFVRGAMSPPRVGLLAAMEEESTAAPCLAFPSQDGYKVISLPGTTRDGGEVAVRLRPVLGRRVVPSPYGGTALAADVCYRHPCHLVDPFTGERAAQLPDLPLPRSETEPVPCEPHEPRPRCAVATDDGLAWDWSPAGVVVARGDTAFFCALHAGGEGDKKWEQVHQAADGSAMTVNHRGGRFFLLELRTLKTTVIDAATQRVCAEIPPPPGGVRDIDAAYLAPASAAGDEALMLVHRAGDRRGTVFTEAFRARLKHRRKPRWTRVEDVGDSAVFIDGAHGFTVRAGQSGVLRNRVYVTLAFQVKERRAATAVYGVGVVDLRRPEIQERMKLDTGEVERVWGCQPYWIIPKDGPDRRREHDQSAF